jgi:hypothetical protein
VLKLVVSVVKAIGTVIVTEVEHEALVNEIVDGFRGIYVHIFDSSPHYQILFDGKERQDNVLIIMIASLKLHQKEELILDDTAAAARRTDNIFGHPLRMGDFFFE